MEVTRMRRRNLIMIAAMVIIVLSIGTTAFTAYEHEGDEDSAYFRTAYPNQVDTKLDSCTTCHRGSDKNQGDPVTYGSCQWCHYVTNYGGDLSEETLLKTLNSYGLDYKNNGRTEAALLAISPLDSDGDGFKNGEEIAATRFPGNPEDDPSKVAAPSRVFTREQLEQMPQHTQFLLMNASKSTDTYVEYTGVQMGDLINEAGLLPSGTGIYVSAPDGFGQLHPLYPDPSPSLYHVFGEYPAAIFHYDSLADIAVNLAGWCDYSAPSVVGRNDGDPIINPDGLKMILAIKRDGQYLDPGELNDQNKLDGEGPFRVVPPQKVPCPPDQRSTASTPSLPWPYDKNADHNAGFSSRSVTIIKVEPLPEGTTDIDTLEAGWKYIDEDKIVVYGAIDPAPTILEKLDELIMTLSEMDDAAFKNCPYKHCSHKAPKGAFRSSKCPQSHFAKWGRGGISCGHLCKKHCRCSTQYVLIKELEVVKKQVIHGAYSGALEKLQNDIQKKTDGCVVSGAVDRNDWVTDCDSQEQLYWSINEIVVLLNILV